MSKVGPVFLAGPQLWELLEGGVTFDGGVGYPSAQADAATPLQNLGFRTFLPPSDNVGICHLVIRLCQLSERLLCSRHGFFG